MTKKYLSEIIMPEEAEKWEKGQIYAISAPTSIGKTIFAFTTLKDIAVKRNKKILVFSNRRVLKEQLEKYRIGNEDVIDIIMYQKIEHLERISDTRFGLKVQDDIYVNEIECTKYEFIIFDEVHSIFTDHFDIYRENILKLFFEKTIGIYVLLSATIEICYSYLKIEEKNQYNIEKDYNYIKNIFYYQKKNINLILDSIPENEKAILFVNKIERGEEINKEYIDNSEFVCSRSNNSYKKHMRKTLKKIAEDECFDCKILITTKVIDNGISIKDETVKHIIIELTYDYEFIQALGRLRVEKEDQQINLYFALDYNRINGQLRYTKQGLNYIFDYEMFLENFEYDQQDINEKRIIRMRYLEENLKSQLFRSLFNNDATINKVSEHILNYKSKQLSIIKKTDYLKYVSIFLYGIEEKAKEFNAFEKWILKEEKLFEQIVNKKLFKEDRKMLFEILKTQIDTKLKRRPDRMDSMNYTCVKNIIEELGLPYVMKKAQERSNKVLHHQNKTYWLIEEKNV